MDRFGNSVEWRKPQAELWKTMLFMLIKNTFALKITLHVL